jgi:hypothetical protein
VKALNDLPADLQAAVFKFQKERRSGRCSTPFDYEMFSAKLEAEAGIDDVNARRIINNICAVPQSDAPGVWPCFSEPDHPGCHDWEQMV